MAAGGLVLENEVKKNKKHVILLLTRFLSERTREQGDKGGGVKKAEQKNSAFNEIQKRVKTA